MEKEIQKLELVLTEATKDIKDVMIAAINTTQPYQIKVPQNLTYVNKKYSNLYSFIRFDEKAQNNVYRNNCISNIKIWEYLIGILDINQTYGNLELRDKTTNIPVRFLSNPTDLSTFKKTLVLLKKWQVFTEIFELEEAETLNFLLINVEDVFIIKSFGNSEEQKCYYTKNQVCNIQGKHTFFEIIRKSEVLIGYNGVPECWVEAAVSDNILPFTERKRIYAVFSVDLNPFIKENMVYKLYDANPKAIPIMSHGELYGLRDIKQLYRLSTKSIFQETDIPPHFPKQVTLFNLNNIKDFMKTCKEGQFFSFCLKISRKQLQVTQFKSWFPKRNNVAYFGNPDDKHQMRLMYTSTSDSGFLDLYLTNRENHLTPMGLIPDMVVLVKNVQVNRGKYLRSTIFTSFEIVDYCPKMAYSSANLSLKTPGSWRWNTTQSTPLAHYFDLPINCIVYGSFVFVALYNLNITPVCFGCHKLVIANNPCMGCKQTERDLKVEITIHARGPTGTGSVGAGRKGFNIDGDKEFFFSLLGLNRTKEVRHFCNAFFKSDALRVDFCKLINFNIETVTRDARSKDHLQKLVNLIYKDINFKLYSVVDAVCLRTYEKNPWLLLDFEMVHNSSIFDL